MRDSILPIRKAIFQKLKTAITDYPVYYGYLPHNILAEAYVIIDSVSSNDTSTMHSHDTQDVIQVGIYSQDTLSNQGLIVDEIADVILRTLLPTPQAKLDLGTGFQSCGMRKVSDNHISLFSTNTSVLINRFIAIQVLVAHPIE